MRSLANALGILGGVASDKPRILHSPRDMALSLIPLILVCLVIAGIANKCTFSPGGPKQGPVPSVDVDRALQADARALPFPIRKPVVPEGWQANSGSGKEISGGQYRTSSIGYNTRQGRYVQMTQSDAPANTLVSFIVGQRQPTGNEQVDATTWVVYAKEDEDTVWVADLTDVRILLRGNGDKEEFTDLARAIVNAQPLAR